MGRLKAFSLYGSQIGLLSWGFSFGVSLPSVFNLRNVVHSLKLEEERKESLKGQVSIKVGCSPKVSQHSILLEFKIK